MSQLVSIADEGDDFARNALERCVRGGGVAVFPADGLYGLACDPLNEIAIKRIHELKGRDDGKPSAVMYFAPLAMRELFGEVGSRTREAMAALMPGPVTLVIANPAHRYPLACREDPERLGIRLIAGPFSGAMCPVFQTSANRSGEPPPARFKDLGEDLVERVELAIDGGELTGNPSTVIDITRLDPTGEWFVLREGGMTAATVEELLSELGAVD